MKKTILITGGAGFIGSNLVDHISRVSPESTLRVLDNLSTGLISNIQPSCVDFVEGSVLDDELLQSVTRDVGAVIHLAALGSVPRSIEAPLPSHDSNVTGTLKVLEAARANDVPQVIIASSSSVYGSNPSTPRHEGDWTRPLSPYAASKLAAEAYGLAYNSSYGMKNLAFRFFNVYGPRQRPDGPYAAVIPKFLSRALNDDPLEIHGDGTQSRDFTYVGSVCALLYRAIETGITSDRPVNLAFGSRTDINGLVQLIEGLLDKKVDVVLGNKRPGDVLESQADTATLASMFPGFEPEPLVAGLGKTINWFRQEA